MSVKKTKEIVEHLISDDGDRFMFSDAYAAIEPEIKEDDTADDIILAMLGYIAGYLK